jgi:transcriptional regulator with XRE-family HTH domain
MRPSLRIDNGDMSGHEQASELGAFLKACRARVRPEQAGLVSYGDRRRVAGLRREELALLAGVSPSYYARLEQGQSRHASPEVLAAIAAVLALDPVERQHLHVLAESAGRRRVTRSAPIEQADPALTELLDAMPTVPAIILGRHSDVLAWNPMGHALLLGHLDYACVSVPGRRPNLIELVFLDPDVRALFADWPRKARAVVGNLRRRAHARRAHRQADHGESGIQQLVGRSDGPSLLHRALRAAPPADRGPHHHPADSSLDPGSRPNDRDLHGPR